MDIRVIRTEVDYAWAMAEADRYFADQPDVGSSDGDRFEVLLMLIESYEDRHFPIEDADPIDMLNYAITDLGRSQKELADLLGARSRASEILNRKRPLSLDQIRRISEAWRLPIASLTKPYALDRKMVEPV